MLSFNIIIISCLVLTGGRVLRLTGRSLRAPVGLHMREMMSLPLPVVPGV